MQQRFIGVRLLFSAYSNASPASDSLFPHAATLHRRPITAFRTQQRFIGV